MLSLSDGKILVKLARQAIISTFNREESINTKHIKLNEKTGVFISLHEHKTNELRGCIGFSEAAYPLSVAVIEAAKAAAFSDSRFQPIQENELGNMTIEISVLTKPTHIYNINEIELGKDGLIVERGSNKGLLLPQVAVEYNWGREEFLSHACNKAGLPLDYWKNNKIKIYKFQAEIFKEKEPCGAVEKC